MVVTKAHSILFLILPTLWSCTYFVTPKGDWIESVDLRGDPATLKGKVIGLECGWNDGGFFDDRFRWEPYYDGNNRTLDSKEKSPGTGVANPDLELAYDAIDNPNLTSASCVGLAKVIKSTGATIWHSSQDKPLFKVRYLDTGAQRDYCGLTLLPFLLSFTLFPCVESMSTNAELSMSGQFGKFQKELKFATEIEVIYGPAALYFYGVDIFRDAEHTRSSRKRRLAHNLLRSIQNQLYSFSVQVENNPASEQKL